MKKEKVSSVKSFIRFFMIKNSYIENYLLNVTNVLQVSGNFLISEKIGK